MNRPPHSSNSFRGFHYIKRLNFDSDKATPDTFGENYSVMLKSKFH